MPKGFEPSDSVFANDTLFVVSDDSRLLAMDKNGDNVRVVTIGSGKREWDLEALTFVPGRPFLYIGVEEPQLILEFDVRKLEVTREWDISHSFKELPENAGMEALAYIKTNRSTTGGYFYGEEQTQVSPLPVLFDGKLTLGVALTLLAGCQHDARIFVFNINLDAAGVHPPELVAVIHDHPGPDFDFSAASVRKHQLYLLFDKAKTLIHLDLNSHEKLLIPRTKGLDDPSKLPFDISAKNATHEHYVFPTRGQEGFSISDEYAFLSVDSPTVKEIHRYSIEQMQRCFKTHGSGLFDEGED